jgi:hypothetical protein
MNKFFTFILAVLLFTSLSAQKTNLPLTSKSAFSAGQRPDSTIVSIMDDGWTFQSKTVYTYHEIRTESLNYYWDTLNLTWIEQIYTIDTLNNNGDQLNEFKMARNPSTWEWDTLSLYTKNYDPVLGIISWDYDAWNTATHSWNDLMKGEYDYFENGRELTYLLCNWNSAMTRWDSVYFLLTLMNVNGKDSIGTFYRWTTQDNPRYIDYYFSYSYDENGNDTLYLDENPADPDAKSKSVNVYNEQGLKTYQTSYEWVNSAWEESYRIEFAYDDEDNLILRTNQEWNGDEWISVRKEENYYPIETGIYHEASEPGMRIYPNPASDYFNIYSDNISSSATIELFNLNGSKMLEQRISHSSISVRDLPKGIYLYQINDSGKVWRGKVVLK